MALSDPKPEALNPPKSKILVVDDNPAIRLSLLRLLEGENYFVLAAANGFEALELAGRIKFDLVLLDLNMPVKDGWETLKDLSAKNPLLPVILITARPNQLFSALASGADALLEKPLDFIKLFETIRKLLVEPPETRRTRLTLKTTVISDIPTESKPEEHFHKWG